MPKEPDARLAALSDGDQEAVHPHFERSREMKSLRFLGYALLAVLLPSLLLSLGASPPPTLTAASPVILRADFTFSGTFVPMSIDTNQDGTRAEMLHAEVNGRLEGPGTKMNNIKLTTYREVVEYGLRSPSDACTSCFRVNEGDYSVQENAYVGPVANLIRPIRDLEHNPTSSPFSAEEWTSFYRLETGELIYTQITLTQICVEKADASVSPVPICHVKQTEKIVGGTGRFRFASGDVSYTAIAPTYTSDAPLIGEDGCIDLSRRPPSFATGPIHGAGRMNVQVRE
jgi:hypothetical protein